MAGTQCGPDQWIQDWETEETPLGIVSRDTHDRKTLHWNRQKKTDKEKKAH